MWIFTDIADAYDRQEAKAQDALQNMADDAGASDKLGSNIKRGWYAFLSGVVYFPKLFTNTLRLGDGVRQGTLKGVSDDLFRVLDVTGVGKVAGKVLQKVGGRVLNGAVVTGVRKSAVLNALSNKVTFKVINSRAYVPLRDLYRLSQMHAGLARAQARYTAHELKGVLQRLGIMRVSGINGISLKELTRAIPKDGALFANVSIQNAHHAYKTTVMVSKNFRDRLVVKGDHGVYGSLEKWLKAEHPSVRAATVNYTDVAEGVKFNNELKQTALDIFLLIEGVAIDGKFDPVAEMAKDAVKDSNLVQKYW